MNQEHPSPYVTFVDWAEAYFTPERLNKKLPVIELKESYCLVGKGTISIPRLMQQLSAWCAVKGYVYNPEHLKNSQGRILGYVPQSELVDGIPVPTGRKHYVVCVYLQAEVIPESVH